MTEERENLQGNKQTHKINLTDSQDSQTSLANLITVIADKAEPLLKILIATADKTLASNEAKARFKIHMAWVALIVVGLIVLTSAFLTWDGKMEGSTFGFLLGLITGYALTFIKDAIGPKD